MAGLASLYEGAALGPSYSTTLGQSQQEDEDVGNQVRGNLLATAVAQGKLNPQSLSGQDAALLGGAITKQPALPSSRGNGFFGSVLGAVETPFKIVLNTAGDFASAVEGVPQGLEGLWNAAYTTLYPIGSKIDASLGLSSGPKPTGPNLGDVAKTAANQTVSDFTNFDPMHPLYPALDIASLISGGSSLAARVGSGLARAGEEGGRVARVGEALQRATGTGKATRDAGLIAPSGQATDVEFPEVPAGSPSVSPFRRTVLEAPIDSFFKSGIANMNVPGLPKGTTLQDVRGQYHIRKIANATRGRTAATAVNETAKATQPFNQAMHDLLGESTSEAQAAEKFNAVVLRMQLATEHMEPAQALQILDEYRDRVLATGTPYVEGAERTVEAKNIRTYYRRLTATSEYRTHFAYPTTGMLNVREKMDQALVGGLKALNLDPREVLHRSLGPAAFVRGMTPEEVLREQPWLVQSQTNFAIKANEVEKAIREAKGGTVPQESLLPQIAAGLPGSVSVADKVKLLQDAVDSLKEDINGTASLHLGDYLPGRNLAQKVAAGLHDRLGVDQYVAERYATGGLTNYFPGASATRLTVRPARGRVARTTERLTGGKVAQGASRTGLHEFKREPTMRLLRAEQLGVAPFADFLHESDLTHFRSGVDRRDPVTFVRHVQQRERLLSDRLLSEPLVQRLALKDADGVMLTVKSQQELIGRLGSNVAASKWKAIPYQAIRTLTETETSAGRRVAEIIEQYGGNITKEASDQIDQIIDEEAQMFARNASDDAIQTEGRMIVVPTTYFNNLVKQAKVMDFARGPGHLWQGFINRWRTAVLAYMPSWLLRTSVGHGVALYIGGVWNPSDYIRASTYFKDGFKVPGTDMKLVRGLGRDVPAGVEQGTPHEDFGRFGMQRLSTGRMAQLTTHGVHRIANFQRRAAFISLLNRVTRQHWTELEDAFKVPDNFKGGRLTPAGMDEVMKNHPELVHHTLNELDRVSYTFGQMSPWERQLSKNFMPFWGWYKFISKFVWSLPVTYPGRALAISRIGQLGISEQNQLGPMPDWLRASVLFNTHNLSQVHYLSMLGLNPLGDVANPGQGFQGLIRLGQMSPVMQAILEGAGYNTLTGGLESIDPTSGIEEINGQYVNLRTGQGSENLDQASPLNSVARAVGGLLRSFPEIRIGEQIYTGGRATYPESIPFVYERPIPLAPGSTPKNVSPLATAGQYAGIKPNTYNLGRYQQNLLQDIIRARSAFRTAARKEAQK